MDTSGEELLRHTPNQPASEEDTRLTVAQKLLNSEGFKRMVDSEFLPIRAVAIGCLLTYAFSLTIHDPEQLDYL